MPTDPDLRTRYLGLELAHPVVASAGPATARVESLAALGEAGVAAVVLPSLFEEEIVHAAHEANRMLGQGAEVFAESLTYFPEPSTVLAGLESHLALVSEARRVLDVPVIASVNGVSHSGWTRYAADLVDAGAHAIELNPHAVAVDPDDTAADVEARLLDVVGAVRAAVRVPVSVKLGTRFTAPGNVVRRLVEAGVDGVVLFDRVVEPDLALDTLEVTSTLALSTSAELRASLRWIAILRGRVDTSLALSTGVDTSDDVVKAVLAGADAVMTTSALVRHGAGHVRVLVDGLRAWLAARDYESVEQAKGSVSRAAVARPDAYERATYSKALRRWSTDLRI
jgi:dihydroorotate dehydrogenase (fumarate)